MLDANGHPKAVDDPLEWARWFEKADRRVALTELAHCRVSTVFLGVDHSWRAYGPPVLWETMAFASGDWTDMEREGVFNRYTSLEAAKAGHEDAVRIAREMERVAVEGSKEAFEALMSELLGMR